MFMRRIPIPKVICEMPRQRHVAEMAGLNGFDVGCQRATEQC